MRKPPMKLLWFILSLIPVPFLFHFYEYSQHMKQEEAPFLFIASILFVLILGFLSGLIKIRYIILVNVITGLLSLFLAMYFIPDDGAWFIPFGRNVSVILTAIAFTTGQLLVRMISGLYFAKKR